jgi:hypothetical protein
MLMMYGLSNILVYGSGPFNILNKIRLFCSSHLTVIGEMLECMMCTSTNIGWIFSLLNVCFFPSLPLTPFMNIIYNVSDYWLLIIVLDAFFTSGAVWLIHSFQELLESLTNYLNKDDFNNE